MKEKTNNNCVERYKKKGSIKIMTSKRNFSLYFILNMICDFERSTIGKFIPEHSKLSEMTYFMGKYRNCNFKLYKYKCLR